MSLRWQKEEIHNFVGESFRKIILLGSLKCGRIMLELIHGKKLKGELI